MTESRPIEELDRRLSKVVRLAIKAKKRAHAPYSKYRVGAVLIDTKGKLHSGCNVENSSYGATICAERVALGKMVSRGSHEIKGVIVVASSDEPVFPCGLCLQALAEFSRQVTVWAVNGRGTLFREARFDELFPQAFTSKQMKG